MGWLSTTRRTFIEAQVTRLTAQIALQQDLLDTLIAQEVDEYTFSTGAGSQRAKRKSVDDVLNQLEKLHRMLEYWQAKLDGTGIIDLNLRRRPL